ncbi:unnamed protein product [Arabidopsis thaliana]|uniref:(thale cress) hypothetical protein n=1 Tax=Arabidopsis thaliana TaxID=3702 RepID=A0A7G2ES66_ARATH|nr:unnamed protein product [Arabidopsis thaliana]
MSETPTPDSATQASPVQLKEHGVSPNVNAYATLVRILSNWGLDRKLDSVLVELIENEERGFSVMDLIEVIGEDGEEDNQSLVLIRVSGALVKAYVVSAFLTRLSMFCFRVNVELVTLKDHDALLINQFLLSDERVFNNRYEDSIWKQSDKGTQLLYSRRMVVYKLGSEAKNVVVVSQRVYWTVDLEFVKVERKLEIDTSPDVITYNVLVSGCARNGHADEALEIYEIMKEEGLQPNDVTHNVIIEGLCSARKVKEAEDFLESLEQKCPENYASLVKCYYESGLSKKAFEQFVRLEFLLRKSVYIKLFTSLCIEGYLDKALRVLKTMWAYRVEPGKSMCGKMIGALVKRAALKQKRFQYNYGEHMQQERVSHAKEELAWYRASSGKNLHSNIDKTHQLSTKLKETEEDSMQLAPASSRQNLVGLLKSEQNHFRLIQEETVKLARVL